MCSILNEKGAIPQLNASLRNIVAKKGPTYEMVYRIEKLILRLDAMADKIFIKTVKAQAILLECVRLTEQFRSNLYERQNLAFFKLTRIEDLIDELVKKTYEFRIKAG